MRNQKLSAFTSATLALTALLAAAGSVAHAGVILSMESASAAAGSSSNQFDVLLTNTGPSSVTISSFGFSISVANSAILFNNASTQTGTSYIFGLNSLFGPDLTGPISSQSLTASDLFTTPASGSTIGSGVTVALGHVLFSVTAGASAGLFAVTFDPFPSTSIADPSANNIAINGLQAGAIMITGGTSAVPEPKTAWLALSLLATMLFARRNLAR
jgi:hypothetical protein